MFLEDLLFFFSTKGLYMARISLFLTQTFLPKVNANSLYLKGDA